MDKINKNLIDKIREIIVEIQNNNDSKAIDNYKYLTDYFNKHYDEIHDNKKTLYWLLGEYIDGAEDEQPGLWEYISEIFDGIIYNEINSKKK